MDYSILEEMYYGNVNPNTQYFSKQSEFGRAMKVLSDRETELTALLNENEKEVLQRFANAQLELNSLTAKAKFLYGFKLGAQIMLEALEGIDENDD